MSHYFANFKKSYKLKNNVTYYILMVFLVVMIVLSSAGMLKRSTLGVLTPIAYNIILAVSLNLVVGFLGELSLGHAGFMCIGAYIGCRFAQIIGEGIDNKLLVLLLAMLVGGLTAAVFGFIVGLPALRLKGDYLAIVTLAFGEIVRNIFNNLPYFGGAMGLQTKTYNPKELFIIAFIVVILVLFLCNSLIRSKHGRAITAIRDNEIAAKSMGINVTYYKLFVFVLAAFFAGIAGVIYGNSISIINQNAFDYNKSIDILVMVVLGGMGSMNGSIISAALITYINALLQKVLVGDLAAVKQPIYAIILIAVVLFSNAPAMKPFKEKFNLRHLAQLIFKNHKNPAFVREDEAEWNRIETKIDMDEHLLTDLPRTEQYRSDLDVEREEKK